MYSYNDFYTNIDADVIRPIYRVGQSKPSNITAQRSIKAWIDARASSAQVQ
eukprot:CAMPEP_0119136272 /NCGR_PEP_ID=MMETSP1310-20130426/21085_1 /TAXON_ID=464262 /ORGANISM="Genus nov. species nov., Strain RCC2339" /LENGTH=50 /DNA_ID=CAMNT_0007127249 /DNA_START=39 /DNA_END=188 /DNA_ORIENTATION=+